jgi:Bacterial DNA-binding protein
LFVLARNTQFVKARSRRRHTGFRQQHHFTTPQVFIPVQGCSKLPGRTKARTLDQILHTIPGLGKIVLVNPKACMGRNPATGETIEIAAKRVVKFRVAKAATDAILGSK